MKGFHAFFDGKQIWLIEQERNQNYLLQILLSILHVQFDMTFDLK